jgi:hypothetical protein
MKMKIFLASAAAAAALSASAAQAADFSFVGILPEPNTVLFFDFTVGSASAVTLRTYSYAGGTNAAGTIIARGGFDPILSLYNVATGQRAGQNDDGTCGQVALDPTTGSCYDTYLQSTLAAGTYRVAVTAFSNFGPATLGGAFENDGDFDGRTANFAFDVLNVGVATGPGAGAVPEPATWGMMIAGFGMMGAAMRTRRRSTKVSYA